MRRYTIFQTAEQADLKNPSLILNLREFQGRVQLSRLKGDDSWIDYSQTIYSSRYSREISAAEDLQVWLETYLEKAKNEGEINDFKVDENIEDVPVGVAAGNQAFFRGAQLSGWWPRAAALILDGIFAGLIANVLLYPVLAIAGIEQDPVDENATASEAMDAYFSDVFWKVALISIVLSFIVYIFYFGLAMARKGKYNGQSLGKQILGIRVVREDGKPVNFSYAVVRQILVIQILFGILMLPFLYIPTIINYLRPIWNKGNKALHDSIVKSRVVRD
jgi:uncharacterized RDD family membrane protein YckC